MNDEGIIALTGVVTYAVLGLGVAMFIGGWIMWIAYLVGLAIIMTGTVRG